MSYRSGPGCVTEGLRHVPTLPLAVRSLQSCCGPCSSDVVFTCFTLTQGSGRWRTVSYWLGYCPFRPLVSGWERLCAICRVCVCVCVCVSFCNRGCVYCILMTPCGSTTELSKYASNVPRTTTSRYAGEYYNPRGTRVPISKAAWNNEEEDSQNTISIYSESRPSSCSR